MMGKKGFLAVIVAVIILVTQGVLLSSGGAIISGTLDIGDKEDKIMNTYWEAEQYETYLINAATIAIYKEAQDRGKSSSGDCFYGVTGVLAEPYFGDYTHNFELFEGQTFTHPTYDLSVGGDIRGRHISLIPGGLTVIHDTEYDFDYSFSAEIGIDLSCSKYQEFLDSQAPPEVPSEDDEAPPEEEEEPGPTPPSPASGFLAQVLGPYISLNWNFATDTVDTYYIHRKEGQSAWQTISSSSFRIASQAPGGGNCPLNECYLDQDVASGKTYCYVVIAENQGVTDVGPRDVKCATVP